MRHWLGLLLLGLSLAGLAALLLVLGLTEDGQPLGVLANRMQILDIPAGVLAGFAVWVWKKIAAGWPTVKVPLRDALWPRGSWRLRRRAAAIGAPVLVLIIAVPLTVAAFLPDPTPPPPARIGPCPSEGSPVRGQCVWENHDHGKETIGYLDDGGRIFGDPVTAEQKQVQAAQNPAQQAEDRRFVDDQKRILDENTRAQSIAANSAPRRSVMRLIYFAGLTTALNDDYDSAEAEELEGLLMAQKSVNAINRNGPVLEIVIANGGAKMLHADYVAQHILVPLYQHDPSVLGVVGLDRSTTVTQAAIATLDHSGIPAIATTLSSDDIEQKAGGGVLGNYFQLSSPNKTEAALIADYVHHVVPAYFKLRKDLYNSGGKTLPTRLTIYQPRLPADPNTPPGYKDLYTSTLVQDLQNSHLFNRRLRDQSAPALTSALDDSLCGASSVIIYAGRHDRNAFTDFLDQMKRCRGDKKITGKLPFIIADDGITRFVADPDKRDPKYQDIEVSYVTKGIGVLRTGRSCVTANGSPDQSTFLGSLCAAYARLVTGDGSTPAWATRPPLWMGERVGLAYDAAQLFTTAAAAPGPLLAQSAVRARLKSLAFTGVAGTVDYSGSQIPPNTSSKPMAVVRIPMDSIDGRPGCEYEANGPALGGPGRLNGTNTHPCPPLA